MVFTRTTPLTVVLCLVTVALAGCAGDDQPDTETPVTVEPETFELEAGTGAIAGLLVDDRFRPIHLTDAPQTEFQTTGFVLLQETGEQIQTTENGEFAFVDLDPGQYTLRVTADGFEATPTRVSVEEGVFNEASLVARRVSNADDSIITEEYSFFVPCQVSVPASTVQCGLLIGDRSGDTDRQNFRTDYTELPAEHLVIEMVVNKEASRDGALKVVARNETDDCYIMNSAITEGSYIRAGVAKGTVSEDDIEGRNCRWTNEAPFTVQLWAQGMFKDETSTLLTPVGCMIFLCGPQGLESRGLGLQAGVKAQVVVSTFLYQPDPAAVEAYCTLC